jgi:predicted nucleic acid-binding protein
MRVLVDTSVWIDFLRPGETPHTLWLKQAIRARHELCTAGIVVCEVLGGIEHRLRWAWARRELLRLTRLDVDGAALACATLCQRQGREARILASANDWLVVALAKRHGVRLLYDDPLLDAIGQAVGFPCVDPSPAGIDPDLVW